MSSVTISRGLTLKKSLTVCSTTLRAALPSVQSPRHTVTVLPWLCTRATRRGRRCLADFESTAPGWETASTRKNSLRNRASPPDKVHRIASRNTCYYRCKAGLRRKESLHRELGCSLRAALNRCFGPSLIHPRLRPERMEAARYWSLCSMCNPDTNAVSATAINREFFILVHDRLGSHRACARLF